MLMSSAWLFYNYRKNSILVLSLLDEEPKGLGQCMALANLMYEMLKVMQE